jgi:hypothetical protein
VLLHNKFTMSNCLYCSTSRSVGKQIYKDNISNVFGININGVWSSVANDRTGNEKEGLHMYGVFLKVGNRYGMKDAHL